LLDPVALRKTQPGKNSRVGRSVFALDQISAGIARSPAADEESVRLRSND